MVTLLVVLLGLGLLYFWLRGWWFAGLVVGLVVAYTLAYGAHAIRPLGIGAAIGFAPWLAWKAAPHVRQFVIEAHREKQARAIVRQEQERAKREWLALPRAERRRRNEEWRAAQRQKKLLRLT